MKPFIVKPKRWWQWLQPSFRRHKRIMEALAEYEWTKGGMKEKCEKAMRDAILYGEGKVKIEWDVKAND